MVIHYYLILKLVFYLISDYSLIHFIYFLNYFYLLIEKNFYSKKLELELFNIEIFYVGEFYILLNSSSYLYLI